jgi:hypothetical protein
VTGPIATLGYEVGPFRVRRVFTATGNGVETTWEQYLMAVPPSSVTWDGLHDHATVAANAPLSLPVRVPRDCRIRLLPAWLQWIGSPAMFGLDGIVYLNPRIPLLTAETIIHELVHWMQRRRMRPSGYLATYLLQIPSAVWRALRYGGRDAHGWHPMEREARQIAEAIVAGRSSDDLSPLDAPTLIEQLLPAT